MGILLTCLLVVSSPLVPASEATVIVIGKEGRTNHNLNGVVVGRTKPDASPQLSTIATVIPKKLQKAGIRFVIRVGNKEFTPQIWNVDAETGTMVMTLLHSVVNLPHVTSQPKELEPNTECYLVYRNFVDNHAQPTKTFRENITYDTDRVFTEESPKPVEAIGCGVFNNGFFVGLFGEDGVLVPAQLIQDIIEGEPLK